MNPTASNFFNRMFQKRQGIPTSPLWTIDPVEIAAQNFEQSGAPIRTELYGNVPGAMDIASRRPPLAPAIPSYSPPALSIGPSPNPNPEPLRDAQELNLPQSIPPMPPVGAQMGAGAQAEDFGGMGAGMGGYVPLTPPVRREIPIQSYAFPNAPQAPKYQAAPVRNLEAERKSLNRGTGLAGLAGLLLGGAPGALAAASSYQNSGQKSFDGQFGQQVGQVDAQNAMLGNQFKNQLGQYDSQLDAIRMQMTGDDRDATLIERQNANEERFYNQNEANRIKVHNAGVADRAKAAARAIAQQRANAGDVSAEANYLAAMSMIDYRTTTATQSGEALDQRKLMDGLSYGLNVDKFNQQKEFQAEQQRLERERIANQKAHNEAMEAATNEAQKIRRDYNEWQKTKPTKGTAGLTLKQQLDIDKELSDAPATVQGLRARAGKAPDVTKDPVGYAKWAENKKLWDTAAEAKAQYFDSRATVAGYRKLPDGRYEKMPPAKAPALVDLGKPPVKARGAGIPSNPPKTLEGRGVAPTANPAAQSGNRAAMNRSATPAPRPIAQMSKAERVEEFAREAARVAAKMKKGKQ